MRAIVGWVIVSIGFRITGAAWLHRFSTSAWPEVLAEREGFEPPIPVKVYTLSRRAPSATRPSLRAVNFHFHFTKEVHWSGVDQLDFGELNPWVRLVC